MATIIQIRRGTAAQWASTNPILADGEFAYEKDTNKIKIGDGTLAWNSLPYAYAFTFVADATELVRGMVEAASDVEMQALAEFGATGAMLFVRPSKLRSYRDIMETTASLAGSTLTCNCANKIESHHVYSTVTTNISIVFSNKTNSQTHTLVIALTGSNIVLTFESDVRMDRTMESGSWNATTKALTVSAGAAGDLFEFSLLKTGSVYILRYGGPSRP